MIPIDRTLKNTSKKRPIYCYITIYGTLFLFFVVFLYYKYFRAFSLI